MPRGRANMAYRNQSGLLSSGLFDMHDIVPQTAQLSRTLTARDSFSRPIAATTVALQSVITVRLGRPSNLGTDWLSGSTVRTTG